MKSKCGKFVRLDKNAVEVVTKLANENVELKAENAKLKKRVQTLAQTNRELTNENDAYFTLAEKQEAKIAELKEENKKLSTIINNARHTINNMRKADADAVREMVKKVKHISLLGGFVALRLDHILEYADKQEKDDG